MKKTRVRALTRGMAAAAVAIVTMTAAATLMALTISGCGAIDASGAGKGLLSIGCGAAGGRAVTEGKDLPGSVLAALRYDFTLEGPESETLERSAYGGETLNLSVHSGAWSIGVKAFLAEGLAGTGSASVMVAPGYNAVRVPMLINHGYFDVIIPEFTGGVITADPPSAFPGTRITLTATPNSGLVLKEGSVKTDPPLELSGDGEAGGGGEERFVFTMPESDVRVIEAVFAAQFGLAILGPQDTSVKVYCDYTGEGDPVVSYTADGALAFWTDDPAFTYENGTLRWLIDGMEKTGAGDSFTFYARDYLAKTYTLTVMIKIGSWYSISGYVVVEQ